MTEPGEEKVSSRRELPTMSNPQTGKVRTKECPLNWTVRPLSVISARTDMEIRGPKSKCNRWGMKGRVSEHR